MAQPLVPHTEHRTWKMIFLALCAFIIIIMPALSHSYGESGDEWVQMEYGRDIYNYFHGGNPQALSYENSNTQHVGLEFYGGLYDYSMELLHHAMPGTEILTIRHFCNSLLGALMMIFTGLLTFRLSRRWMPAVLALLFMFFSPRIFGESMNNPKDIPFAAGFIICVYYLVALLQDLPKGKWKYCVGMALGFAIAFGIRPAGGVLLVAYAGLFTILYYLLVPDFKALLKANNWKALKQLVLVFAAAFLAGYIIGILCWPYGLQSPISNTFTALSEMTNRKMGIRVLFDGNYILSRHVPASYEFKWICISSPLIVLAGLIIFIVLFRPASKKYTLFTVLLLLFCAFFPLLYMIYKKSTVYDTWRHVFFVYPFWAIMGAMGFDVLRNFIKNEKLQWLPYAVAIAGLIPTIAWTISTHPNQYVYFNELEGGVKGASGNYDLDYYQNTSTQAADWIRANVKPEPGKKVIVASNMTGFYNLFGQDTTWIQAGYARYAERYKKDWDYFVVTPRFFPTQILEDNKWLPGGTVHVIYVKGMALCAIIKRQSKMGIAASDAMQKKDFPTAVKDFQQYIAADSTDGYAWLNYAICLTSDGKLDSGVSAAQKAIQLVPDEPQFYQILAQLYQAKGDNNNAQQAMSQAQALAAKEQEDEE